ncbi:MAG: hypothetical protein IJX26_03340 [Clostridia bacterium]|nr:hypothetical protein [Clostridia bacterium]
MQEKSNQSKTKFKVILIAICVLLFSLTMLFVSAWQIVNINKLNSKLDKQEEILADLNSQLSDQE